MSKPCSICNNQNRTRIETEILNRTPYRDIEKWYGVGRNAISLHKNGHMSMALIKATPPAIIAEDASLTDQLKDIHGRTLRILQDAEASGDGRTALVAIRECRSNLELLAKIELILADRLKATDKEEHKVVFITAVPCTMEQLNTFISRRISEGLCTDLSVMDEASKTELLDMLDCPGNRPNNPAIILPSNGREVTQDSH